MSVENFIRDALYKPNDYIAYHVGRELMELHPGKTILEGQTWYFDLDDFVRAEKCSVIEEKSVFHNIKTEWEGAGNDRRADGVAASPNEEQEEKEESVTHRVDDDVDPDFVSR